MPAAAEIEKPSWYHLTAPALPPGEPLAGGERFDAIVIGGGFTGLGAALTLAKAGRSVLLLEQGRIGQGASGRNGGQVHPLYRLSMDVIERMRGAEEADRLFALGEEARAWFHDLRVGHGIDCDWRPGLLAVAHRPAEVPEFHEHGAWLTKRFGYSLIEPLDGPALARILDARGYHGGVLDHGGGHLHPQKYAIGLARAAQSLGARIVEGVRAASLSRGAGGLWQVQTGSGPVSAPWVMLAGDGMMHRLHPGYDARVMPLNNYILVTEPLGENRARSLIANDAAVSDSRFVVYYFRRTPDHRLLFGGGETFTRREPEDLRVFVQRHLLKVFPQLADAAITHAWGGVLGITRTRLPLLRRLEPGLIAAGGYSGVGVLLAPFFGRVAAEAMLGTEERFDVFARLPVPPFPGGRSLRVPLTAMALFWYKLRDSL